MSDSTVTLVILGSPVTFTVGSTRVEGCKKYKVGGRFPPGPCRKNGAPPGAEPVDEADVPPPRRRPARKKAVEPAPPREVVEEPDPEDDSLDARIGAIARQHVKNLVAGIVPLSLRREVEAQLLEQARRTPYSMMLLEEVRFGKPSAVPGGNPYQGEQRGSSALYYSGYQAMSFNPKVRSRREEFEGAARRSFASGWWTPTAAASGLEAVTAHEYGHHVAFRTYAKRDQGLGLPLLANVVNPLAESLGIDGPKRDLGGGTRASWDSVDAWMAEHREVFAAGVSKYGSSNFHELMAEMWQEYSTRGDAARSYARRAGAGLARLAEDVSRSRVQRMLGG